MPLDEAQKLSPYPLLKPTYSPFKIKHSNASLFDNPSGDRDQEVLITYIGDDQEHFMQIEMQNKENIYGGLNDYEKVDLFQGVKGYVQISKPAASLFWSADGYTILITLPDKNYQYTKSDLIKIAHSLHTIK